MADNFERLKCWQECYELKKYLRENVLARLPKSERFELYSQVLRSSRSATANIAEGWGRYHYKENIKFLLNSRGSVSELLDQSIEAYDCSYISKETMDEIRTRISTCIRLINGYIRFLKNQPNSSSNPHSTN